MSENAYRFILTLLFIGLFSWGISLQSSTAKWTVETPRTMVLVDAYEYYHENGKPGWNGIFRDKQFNTRVENAIEPRTYREFVSSGSVQHDMIVKASLKDVKAPDTPYSGIFFGILLAVFGVIGVGYNLIAVVFFRDPWRFS